MEERELILIEEDQVSLKNLAMLSTFSGNEPIYFKKGSETRGKTFKPQSSAIILISRSNMFRGGKLEGLFHSS